MQEKPSTWNIAQMLTNDPDGILGQIGAKSYLHLLKTIALNIHSLIVESPSLFSKIKSSRFLLGVRHHVKSEEDTTENEYVVSNTSDIFIVDDSISAQLFNLLSTPSGDAFIELYRELGSLKVSEVVETNWYFSGEKFESKVSVELQKRIHQRALFLCNGMNFERPVLPSAHNSLERIQVYEIKTVSVSRSFRGLAKESESTACFSNSGTMLITCDFDYFDVASLLVKLIFAEPRMSDSLLISSFLSMSLKHLQSKGFDVDLFAESDFVGEPSVPSGSLNSTKHYRSHSTRGQHQVQRPDYFQEQNSVDNEPERCQRTSGKTRYSITDFFEKFKSSISGSNQKDRPSNPIYDYDTIQRKLAESSRACGEVGQTDFDLSISREDKPTISAPAIRSCAIPECRLHLIANAGMVKLFSDSSLNEGQHAAFISKQSRSIQTFIDLLCTLGNVFGLSQKQINVFYIRSSAILAFNRNGCLFFSLDGFLSQQQQKLSRKSIMSSWFVTFAHELAHNFSRYNISVIHIWQSFLEIMT